MKTSIDLLQEQLIDIQVSIQQLSSLVDIYARNTKCPKSAIKNLNVNVTEPLQKASRELTGKISKLVECEEVHDSDFPEVVDEYPDLPYSSRRTVFAGEK